MNQVTGYSRLRFIAALFVFFVATGLSGCIGGGPTIDLVDKSSVNLAGRIVWHPKQLMFERSLGGIEFGYERYRGSDDGLRSADVESGVYSSTLASVPSGQLFHVWEEVKRGGLSYVHTFRAGGRYQVEPSLGVNYSQLTVDAVELTSNPQRFASKKSSFGLQTAVANRWVFNDRIDAEVRIGLSYDTTVVLNADAGVVLWPARNVGVRVGYFWRNLEAYAGENESLPTNIESQFSGPGLLLTLSL